MDDTQNQPEMDPWANMGNMSNANLGEVTPEGEARAAEWTSKMADAPEYSGPFASTPEAAPTRDENISDASAIINYGINAAAKQIGVERTIEIINNFDPSGFEDPIRQLYKELGIDTKEELKDLSEQKEAAQKDEDLFRENDVNAPATINKSAEGARKAIDDVKNLVLEVKNSPDYAELRREAQAMGKAPFEYAVDKFAVRDLTVLFAELGKIKAEAQQKQNTVPEETKEETPTEAAENQTPESPESLNA